MKIQRIRVPIGFVFAALFIWGAEPGPTTLMIGIPVALLGLGIRIWATGHLRKWQGLATTGPYRWTRNPLYFGSVLMGFGFMVASAKIWLVSLFIVLFILIYIPVMRREEGELVSAYGEDFSTYKARVSLFVPGLRPLATTSSNRFSWAQVAANKEYSGVLGFLLMCLLLVARMQEWA